MCVSSKLRISYNAMVLWILSKKERPRISHGSARSNAAENLRGPHKSVDHLCGFQFLVLSFKFWVRGSASLSAAQFPMPECEEQISHSCSRHSTHMSTIPLRFPPFRFLGLNRGEGGGHVLLLTSSTAALHAIKMMRRTGCQPSIEVAVWSRLVPPYKMLITAKCCENSYVNKSLWNYIPQISLFSEINLLLFVSIYWYAHISYFIK